MSASLTQRLAEWWREANEEPRVYLSERSWCYYKRDGSIELDMNKMVKSPKFWEQLRACERIFREQRRCRGEIVNQHVVEHVQMPKRFP